jgi:hypothetical protein
MLTELFAPLWRGERNNFMAKALPVSFEIPQSEKLRAYQIVLDFSTVQSVAQNIDLPSIGLSCVRGVLIDNSLNGASVILTIAGTGQKLTVPPFAQATFPVLQIGHSFQILATSQGAAVVSVQMLNFSQTPFIWYVTAPGTVSGTVQVAGTVSTTPLVSTFTDKSTFIATGGVSRLVLNVNAARKHIIIQNPYTNTEQGIATAENLYISFVGTAVIGPPSIVLFPGGSYESSSAPISSQALTAIAATTGHKFTCWEM